MIRLNSKYVSAVLIILVAGLIGYIYIVYSGGQVSKAPANALLPKQPIPERVTLNDVQARQINIKTDTVTKQTIPLTITRSAEVTADVNKVVEVATGVSGIVRKIHTVPGDKVAADTPLATLESSEMAALQSNYLNTRDLLQLAEVSYQREKRLWQQQITSEEAYLLSKRALQEAQISVRAAEQALQALGVYLQVNKSEKIGTFTLRASISGTVISQTAFLGQIAPVDTPLFVVADLSSVWVKAQLYPNDLGKIAIGENATIVTSTPSISFTGQVVQVVPNISEATRTALAIISFDNSSHALNPGQFVTVKIPITEKRSTVLVPETALVQNSDGQWQVFIETNENTFDPIEVVINDRSAAGVMISGAPLGATFVTDGAFFLRAELDKGSLVDND
jgi:cobalt-zinc-cadmium efflux system membrane fusion protein